MCQLEHGGSIDPDVSQDPATGAFWLVWKTDDPAIEGTAEIWSGQLDSAAAHFVSAPGPLIARIVMGGLSGACLCASAGRALLPGAVLGGLGAVIGAFAGYQARGRLVQALGVKDSVIALSEDVVAIVLACLFVSWR